MATTGRVLSIVLGFAAVVALAGGAAYFVFDRMTGSSDTVAVRIVELINKPYTLGQTTEIFDRPMADGKFLTRIRQGGSVTVLGIVDGNAWLQIALPGNQVGYIPVATVPGVLSDQAPKVAAEPAPPAPAAPAPAAPATAPGASPTPAAAAPPAASPAPPSDTADSEPEAPPPSDLVDFQTVDRQLSVVQPTGLYLAPNEHAPQAYVVKPGTKVEIIAVSKDGSWGWVNVSDGTPAYLKLADLSGSDTSSSQQ